MVLPAYTNCPERCSITKKSDGNCSYEGNMSNNKVAKAAAVNMSSISYI